MRRTVLYLLTRLARAVFVLLFVVTLVFIVIHLGLHDPADATAGSATQQQQLEQKKEAFGLDRPLSVRYVDYVSNMFTLDFGETWTDRHLAVEGGDNSTSVNAIIYHRLKRTGWLWLWTGLIAFTVVLSVGVISRSHEKSLMSAAGDLTHPLPAFLLALIFESVFFNLGTLLFGLDWRTFLAPTPSTITRPIPLDALGSVDGFLLAAKLAFPPALALAFPLAATTAQLWQQAFRGARESNFVDVARAKGVRSLLVEVKHILPNTTLPLALVAGQAAAVLVGGTIVVEVIFQLDGLGSLFFSSVTRNDYTTLQATLFVLMAMVVGVTVFADIVTFLVGGPLDAERRRELTWTAPEAGNRVRHRVDLSRRLRPVARDNSIVAAITQSPRPALVWLAGGVVLVVLEFGAVVDIFGVLVPGVGHLGEYPTLLNRGLVSNTGYRTPNGGWVGTFLGLSPAYAWGLRVASVYAYACAWVGWVWMGYRLYRTEYRPIEWTPTDDFLARFRNHRLGQFGVLIMFVFLVAAVFAPTVGPTTLDRTNAHTSLDDGQPNPDGSEQITYFDTETGGVKTTTVGTANANSGSTTLASVDPWSYDKYDRFHPFGTTYSGTDLLTEMLHGARVYLVVAGISMLVAVTLTLALGGLASDTNRFVDGAITTMASTLTLVPTLPLIFMVSRMFYPKLYSLSTQLVVWGVLFGLLGWPHLWQTIQFPLSRISRAAWVDAERVVGQPRGHVVTSTLPHMFGPLAVYALLGTAGVVITTAALSYLGHLAPTTPYGAYEWGSLLWRGKQFMLSKAGHTFVIPAVALVVFVTALNALAVGLRDALELADGVSAPGELGRLGGGG